MPFGVALPTYRCAAGYGPDGKLLSVAMDSVQPVWPPGTRVLEFGANADEIATLVNGWQKTRLPQLHELIWYRLPIATDIETGAGQHAAAVGPSSRTQAEYLAGGQEPDRFVDLQCG